jgi:hypothetical protein
MMLQARAAQNATTQKHQKSQKAKGAFQAKTSPLPCMALAEMNA